MIQRGMEILVHRQGSQCFSADASLVPQQQEPGWQRWYSLRFVASCNTNECRVLEVKIFCLSCACSLSFSVSLGNYRKDAAAVATPALPKRVKCDSYFPSAVAAACSFR